MNDSERLARTTGYLANADFTSHGPTLKFYVYVNVSFLANYRLTFECWLQVGRMSFASHKQSM